MPRADSLLFFATVLYRAGGIVVSLVVIDRRRVHLTVMH